MNLQIIVSHLQTWETFCNIIRYQRINVVSMCILRLRSVPFFKTKILRNNKTEPNKIYTYSISAKFFYIASPCNMRRPNQRMINAFMQHFLLLIRDWILRQLLCDALRKDVLFTIPPDLNATYLFIKPFARMPLLHTTVDLVF